MTPERHDRINAIFEAVMDLPEADREAYLVSACRDDTDLHRHVDKLLEADNATATIDEADRLSTPGSTGASVRECPKCSRCYESPLSECPIDGKILSFALPGSLVIDGKYRIERSLGKGGMGAVFLAQHMLLEKHFALKVIATDGPIPSFYRKNFENEALALGKLKHPNIVGVTDYGVDPRAGGVPYLVMDYLEGQTVRQLLQSRGHLGVREAIALLRPIAEAVDFAHQQKIIHGDLKPGNLFLERQRDLTEIPKVVDFGLARLSTVELEQGPVSELSTGSAGIRGTAAYMAPEMFHGEGQSAQSDLFAFGALTYEILTGSAPFGKNLREVRASQWQPPVNPSVLIAEVPAELDRPVLSLLDKETSRRPSTALGAMSAMEEAWLAAHQRQWRERESPRRYGLAVLATIVAMLLAGWLSTLNVVRMLEGRALDLRFSLTPKHPPDPRLLSIALDDRALEEDSSRQLAQWDGKFADLMERVLMGGARAVALDFLLPESYSRSLRFAKAIELYPDRVVLAMFSASGSVTGTECISPLTEQILGPERYAALFGFANLAPDEDQKIRRAHPAYMDRNGNPRLSFAGRAVKTAKLEPSGWVAQDRDAWIDYTASIGDIPSLSWKDANDRDPNIFRDKLVLIGADYIASNDQHAIPASASLEPGVRIQAMIANTIAEGLPLRDAGLPICLIAMGTGCLAMLVLALRFPHRPSWAIAWGTAALCGYALTSLVIFGTSRIVLAVVTPEAELLLSAAMAWFLWSRLPMYPVKEVRT